MLSFLCLSDFGRRLRTIFVSSIVLRFLCLSDFGRRLSCPSVVFVSCITCGFLCPSGFGRRPGVVVIWLFIGAGARRPFLLPYPYPSFPLGSMRCFAVSLSRFSYSYFPNLLFTLLVSLSQLFVLVWEALKMLG